MSSIKKYLTGSNQLTLGIYATLFAFTTYTCMYAFRKAFAVATFDGQEFLGISYKIWLITAQIIGYTISKGIGIKVVAEITHSNRPKYLLGLISAAAFALLLFAIVPAPFDILCLFLNGLPIGMIYGIVFNYLEGRRLTEILVLGLTITQIFSSGFVKSVGKYIMNHWQVSEYWMPLYTGLLFYPILIVSVYMLNQLPDPDEEDVKQRTKREPMNREARKKYVKEFRVGLIIFLCSYVMLTALRDFRDNFAAEIWNSLGFQNQADVFTKTEIPISVSILVLMMALKWIKKNFLAFMTIHVIAIIGAAVILAGSTMYDAGLIGPVMWITLVGLGLYIAYVPVSTIFFERKIASFKYVSNASFVFTMADFYGYCGSVGVLLFKNFFSPEISYKDFFLNGTYVIGVLLIIMLIASAWYFRKRYQKTILNVN